MSTALDKRSPNGPGNAHPGARQDALMVHRLTVLLRSQVCCGAAATPGVPGLYDRFVPPGLIGLLVAMQPGNLAQMGNIAGMDHTNTKWWVRLKQGRSQNRVLRNRVRRSRE